MPAIHIDDQTAKALETIAASCGMSVPEYLASVVCGDSAKDSVRISIPEFDAELEALSIDGPTLPPGFSRADIYNDHD